MSQKVQATLSLTYGAQPQQFSPSGGSGQFSAGVAANGGFNFTISGSASVFSRVLEPLNADYDTGSGAGNEGFRFVSFPAMENSAGDPIMDFNGLPLDFTALTLLAFRVRAIDPDKPWGGTVSITTANDVVPGDKFGQTGIDSDTLMLFERDGGWAPGATGQILVEFVPTDAPVASMVNAFVEMLVIGNPATPVAPAFSAPPTITGTIHASDVLTAHSGTFSGTPAPLDGYQWVRCDTSGTLPGVDLPGENGGTYTLVSADIGYTIRVRQTAANSEGSAFSNSAQTGVIIP